MHHLRHFLYPILLLLCLALISGCSNNAREPAAATEPSLASHQQLINFYTELSTFPVAISTQEMYAQSDAPWPMEGYQLPEALCPLLQEVS